MKITLVFVLLFFSLYGFSQNNISGDSYYVSSLDKGLTIRSIAVLPFKDNVGGTYAKALEKYTKESIKKNHHWRLVELNLAGNIPSSRTLENNPKELKSISRGTNADAFIIGHFTNTPKGLDLKLNLFLASDNKLLLQSKINRLEDFSIAAVQKKYENFFNNFTAKIPYDGLILSRTDNKVTLDLGSVDNVKAGQIVSVAHIVNLKRHPKFNFLISTNKEILGQIRINKVDKYLSFGEILNEKEKGSVQAYSKITGVNSVHYKKIDNHNPNINASGPQGILYGRNPKLWRPSRTPTFGFIGAHLGLGGVNTSFSGAHESADISPSFYLEGEAWLTPTWSLHTELMRGIATTKNFDITTSSYDLLLGYNFRFPPAHKGPHIEVLGGISQYSLKTSGNSLNIPSTRYKGLKFGVQGLYPLKIHSRWAIGGRFLVYLNPDVDTQPNQINGDGSATQFSAFAKYNYNTRLKLLGKLNWDVYSGSFTGASSAQKSINLSAGLRYLF